ncbi:DUF86 domain-containing protein [Methanofollis formosanus]|uniref:DUF86 domain-containing protein n=1 Tax=Methanofollis formosanus TaxID=299308 RepID=A0A8G1A3N1_9EURY|nr:HepT-like ribonuclease domain-containing protein [Methanofollis formosanus]QYZ79848.1 DUF86 domain-containing protein [Methanofollis formosanus]
MKDDRLYLIHILECAGRIESYTRGGRDAFMASPMVQDAVVRNFEIIGEAVKQVSEQVKEKRPDVTLHPAAPSGRTVHSRTLLTWSSTAFADVTTSWASFSE